MRLSEELRAHSRAALMLQSRPQNWRRDEVTRRSCWQAFAVKANYSVAQMARISGVSIRQLERYFKLDTGSSPKAWLAEQQMLSALSLLPARDSIKAVAYELGFKHPSHFSATFKRRFKITPLEYVRISARGKRASSRLMRARRGRK